MLQLKCDVITNMCCRKNECKTVMHFDSVKTRLEDAACGHTERFMANSRQRLRAMSSFVEPTNASAARHKARYSTVRAAYDLVGTNCPP